MTPEPIPVQDVRPVAPSVEALIAGATQREPFAYVGGKSGVRMERVELDGERYVLKYLHVADDWIMRARRSGVPAGVGVALGLVGPAAVVHRPRDRGCGVGRSAAGPGRGDPHARRRRVAVARGRRADPVPQHLRFLDHMAQLHATFWGCPDAAGLLDLTTRYVWLGPHLPGAERAVGAHPVPTRFVGEGWRRFPAHAPRSQRVVLSLHQDPSALIQALGTTPATFVHGDWKASNLGTGPQGRTILLDWAFPGIAPPCSDLAWYICLNRARLPHSKEAAISTYREALEGHGVETGSWWERQLGLCLLGALVQFGWEKALGDGPDDDTELEWWDQRAAVGARYLQ